MDALPTYADLVMTVTTAVFFISYAIVTGIIALAARSTDSCFSLTTIVFALLAAFSGSALSFLAMFIAYGPS